MEIIEEGTLDSKPTLSGSLCSLFLLTAFMRSFQNESEGFIGVGVGLFH